MVAVQLLEDRIKLRGQCDDQEVDVEVVQSEAATQTPQAEILTGRLPYPPGSLDQTFKRHGCDPPADIRRHAGPLPPALVRLVERLLDRRPEQRPKADAVVQQLIALEIASLGRRRAG